jgi:hypothetical protein
VYNIIGGPGSPSHAKNGGKKWQKNIQQGAMAHGIDVDALINDLNQAVSQAQVA